MLCRFLSAEAHFFLQKFVLQSVIVALFLSAEAHFFLQKEKHAIERRRLVSKRRSAFLPSEALLECSSRTPCF